ncbi:hypothetical protein CRE_23623 [Caenorhabditis remanei]|uniref:Uncharacterized protein n=1 Tax=Caenorhabditis remanei TaxID=31234 RepID=E3MVX4_CAERE|nr:hypothetical protein CRE_23623 [Caenorhabditis remanei]
MRAVAKLLLNSLSGQDTDRNLHQSSKVLVHDTSIELLDVRPVNNIVVVQYRKQVETLTSLKTGAVHIAALTTSFGRLRLYKLMEAVGGDNIQECEQNTLRYMVHRHRSSNQGQNSIRVATGAQS